MRTPYLLAALLICLLLPASAAAQAGGSHRIEHVPGSYIVVYHGSVNAPDATTDRLERRHGFDARLRYRHAVKGFSASLSARQVEELRQEPAVDFVSRNRRFHATGIVPLVPGDSAPPGIRRIEAATTTTARDASTVNVAVLDTGIALGHPDLNAVNGKDCIGADPALDDHGHGTHVSGSIGARNNGSGVVGIAPATRLVAVKVLNSQGSGTDEQIICGIDWVTSTRTDGDATNDVRVANMSLGGVGFPVQSCSTTTDGFHLAICNSTSAGVTYVVAAGNSGYDFDFAPSPDVPAAYPEVLTVTAMGDTDGQPGGLGPTPTCRPGEADDRYASFSNFALTAAGRAHTLAGPGVCVFSTFPPTTYNTLSGTSMASPHVAGVVALCVAEAGVSGPCAGLPANQPGQYISQITKTDPAYGYNGDPNQPFGSRYYGYLASAQAWPTPGGSPYRTAVLGTAGLVSYWRLGDSGATAVDSKGPNNGTYFGPLRGQPGALFGDPDTSARFDGVDDYVQVPDFAPPTNLTLEAWIYPQDTATGAERIVFDKGNNEYDLRVAGNGNLQFITGSTVQTATDDSFNYQTPATANRWYHVAVTFDSAADTVRFYRNGNLTKTVTGITAAIQNTTRPLRIGRHSQFNFGTFNGRLDEAALYNTVLSAATIAQHYQAGVGTSDTTPPAPPSGLAASAGQGSISLDWADNSEPDLDGYNVYRSTTAGGPYSKINAQLVATSSYTDTTVSAGITYYYVVRAVDESGNESGPSNEASATALGSPYRDTVLGTAGLVSYWRLGELSGSTAFDSKGTNNGTYFGPVLGQPGAIVGDSNTAVRFDGVDDYVQAPDIAPPTNLTLEAWIYPQDTATGNERIVLGKGNNEYDFRINANGNLQFVTGSTVQTAVDDTFNFQTPAAANNWYHVVLTFENSTDTVRFYRNGNPTKTVGGITAAIQNTTRPFRIGRHSQFNFGTFNGRIDEAALYNTPLSAATIAQHYQAGT